MRHSLTFPIQCVPQTCSPLTCIGWLVRQSWARLDFSHFFSSCQSALYDSVSWCGWPRAAHTHCWSTPDVRHFFCKGLPRRRGRRTSLSNSCRLGIALSFLLHVSVAVSASASYQLQRKASQRYEEQRAELNWQSWQQLSMLSRSACTVRLKTATKLLFATETRTLQNLQLELVQQLGWQAVVRSQSAIRLKS